MLLELTTEEWLEYKKDYPYMCTYAPTLEEADASEYWWIHWNGVAMTPPTFIKDGDQIYTGEQWYSRIKKGRNNDQA